MSFLKINNIKRLNLVQQLHLAQATNSILINLKKFLVIGDSFKQIEDDRNDLLIISFIQFILHLNKYKTYHFLKISLLISAFNESIYCCYRFKH